MQSDVRSIAVRDGLNVALNQLFDVQPNYRKRKTQ